MSWLDRGWQVFDPEPEVEAWLVQAGPAAIRASEDEAARRAWLRFQGPWFVGVDALPNGPDGAVLGGPALGGQALSAARDVTGVQDLHAAQVSVTYPGYPRRDPSESDAAHRFRVTRDAAHLDGLLPVGADKRRYLKEMHAFLLGIAVTEASPDAAPLVVWEGSHILIREVFSKALEDVPVQNWGEIDLTEIYQAVRKHVFDTCPRREIPLRPGQSVLVHRHAIHGVAPWAEGATADEAGRVIIYFRPEVARADDWLNLI